MVARGYILLGLLSSSSSSGNKHVIEFTFVKNDNHTHLPGLKVIRIGTDPGAFGHLFTPSGVRREAIWNEDMICGVH